MSRATRTERACGRPAARRQGGFTLLEILVALVIFATASVIAYSGLNAVISVKGSLDREIRFWRELGLVFDRMDMDFVQILPHSLRAAQGTTLQPVPGSGADDAGFLIELSRHDEDRRPAHAYYRCARGVLSLSLEAINDSAASSLTPPAPSAPPHTLLQNVEQCDAAYLGDDNSWRSAWPEKETAAKPRAIRIRLTLAARGQFERLYYLP
jgi:general secretion pathway protein J